MLKRIEHKTSLLAKEAQGDDIAYSVTMMHGQDHLMTTILLKDLMKHLLEFYKEGYDNDAKIDRTN